jgi:hypothetical protein
LKDGNIDFKILDNSNNTLCSSLGDISTCANTNSPIKLYAELTRLNNTSVSPEIDSWFVQWNIPVSEEIRGGGEMHVSDFLVNLNSSLFSKLYGIQDEIVSVNDTVKSISFNTTELQELVAAVNNSLMNKLYTVQGELSSVNDTIKAANNTLYWQLDNVNSTVVWKLYKIQDEIANVNMTLINATLNITIPTEMNLTNETINAVTDDVIIKMLQNARILNERVVNFHNSQYCIDNSTLQHNITYNYCVGSSCKLMQDIMDENCSFGCDPELKECKKPAYQYSLQVAGGIIGAIILVLIILKLVVLR